MWTTILIAVVIAVVVIAAGLTLHKLFSETRWGE